MQVPSPLVAGPVQELLLPRPLQEGPTLVEFPQVASHPNQRAADRHQITPRRVRSPVPPVPAVHAVAASGGIADRGKRQGQ
jgi:hypothetical protein